MVPLLLSYATLTYHGMTPPQPQAQKQELSRFTSTASDLLTSTTPLQYAASFASKYFLCGVALGEAAVLLAQHLPSTYSDRVLALLLPAGQSVPLRLTTASLAACLLATAGGSIRIWCHRTLGKFFTWQTAVRDDHQLITSGPYAYVRHPSYTGWLLMAAGHLLLVLGRGSYTMESGLWKSTAGRVAAVATLTYTTFIAGMLGRRRRISCSGTSSALIGTHGLRGRRTV
ncbi:ICMT-domain-containing protein [Lentinus tigrinus ALCF2SS1-6]|uniref:Protein-S-isoprenylcysteine O-methyltransferase n=1 Tax=Lentinus tigrinus ALCF2SS1-6 TaxID=1328759 RepID=A0A5C2RWJ7_9APHY|nr:ICMT-domain-containing protein [Lentinus tigrinus ALCF2SS1-6]